MTEDKISSKTRRIVYERWKGRCGFCGVKISVEEHHVVPKSKAPSLTDNPDNLILVCANHHALTHKPKESRKPMISIEDIKDLTVSKYKNSEKRGCNLNVPDENVPIFLGRNKFSNYKYLLVVNKKPLIEVNFKPAVSYATSKTMLFFIKLFDKENNFIGGMFGDYWASVADEPWVLEMTKNGVMAKNGKEDVWIHIEIISAGVVIRGHLCFDGIEIEIDY